MFWQGFRTVSKVLGWFSEGSKGSVMVFEQFQRFWGGFLRVSKVSKGSGMVLQMFWQGFRTVSKVLGWFSNLLVDDLSESHVGDAGGIVAEHVHVRVQHQRVYRLAILAQNCTKWTKLMKMKIPQSAIGNNATGNNNNYHCQSRICGILDPRPSGPGLRVRTTSIGYCTTSCKHETSYQLAISHF